MDYSEASKLKWRMLAPRLAVELRSFAEEQETRIVKRYARTLPYNHLQRFDGDHVKHTLVSDRGDPEFGEEVAEGIVYK